MTISEIRREKGLCPFCGGTPTPGYLSCAKCRKRRNDLRKGTRQAERAERKKREPQKPSLSITQVVRMAEQRGISYGQMVILLEKGEAE